MSIIIKTLLVFFLVITASYASFNFGFERGKEYQKVFQPPENINLSLFWQTWNKVYEKFPDKERLDVQKMIYGAISGMVETLGDPHTKFFTPKETEEFKKGMKGTFEGVGMQIGIREEQLQVISPIRGTPAYKAELRPGDKIIKIDGILTVNMTTTEAVELIRGEKGTIVILTIFRDSWNESREIEIKRGIIEIPSSSWELIDGNIAHLRFYNFIGRINEDFRNIATEIIESPAEKIILDLRNNSGGCLRSAKYIAGWFLKRGQVITIKDSGEIYEQKIYKSRGPSRLLDYPIVVLINRGSASASEILAAALRDNRGIKLIGETSFGKGSVQEVISLKDGASLKITIANWLTPKGELITEKGLKPDKIIEKTVEDFEQERDPQLDKAIEIIKKNKIR
jgi:carboxyl-terminal processing protease